MMHTGVGIGIGDTFPRRPRTPAGDPSHNPGVPLSKLQTARPKSAV
jgi:hypothetical protein